MVLGCRHHPWVGGHCWPWALALRLWVLVSMGSRHSLVGGLSSSRGGALSFVGWALFVPFVGAGSLLVGIWVSFVSDGGLPHATHIVRRGGLMFVGGSWGLQVLSSVCGPWVVVRGHWVVICGHQGVVCGRYALFACSICPSWVGTNVQGHGCSVVVCGHIGAVVCVVLCVVWSSLARTDGTEITDTYLQTTTTNDEIVVVCHLVATSLSVTWQLEAPIPLVGLVTWCCNIVVAEVVGVGDGCEW